MKPKLLLRIASILIFVHGAMHPIGHSGWKNSPQPLKDGVIQQMTGHKYSFMGAVHSYGDYFEGYGYACSVAMILIAVLLWIISTSLAENAALAKKIALAIGIALVFWAGVEQVYFFIAASGLSFLAAICVFSSVFLMKKTAI